MKYIRQFTRKQERNQMKTLEQQKHDLDLARKVLTAVTAFSFIGNPLVSLATTITDVNGKPVGGTGPVRDIYAQQMMDGNKTAVNRFDQFNVSAGDIANMYFQSTELKGSTTWANNLVNFVNNRIDVAGTVNAIKENKIGGNLFFLSSKGMAVTGSGVINAGSLYVMTPTEDFMKGILGEDSRTFNEDQFNSQWSNISKMEIPVNPSGTITVLGTINAANDVKMTAAQIGIGENVSGDSSYNVSPEDAKKAVIKTNVADFRDIVNIKSENNFIDAGLDNTKLMSADVDPNSGDIVLRAVASTVNSLDKNFDKYEGSDNQAKASVVVNGTINARKDAVITAEATNGVKLADLFNNESVIEGDDNFTEAYGQITKNVASVDINGSVTGQHVDIAANTINNYISTTDEDVNLGILTGLAGVITANWDASYAVLANEATVNVNEGAVITANAAAQEGETALNISAESSLKASVGASTSAIKLANLKGSANVPAASVGYAKTDNKAAVNIAGELHSNGHTNISANADSTVELVSADTTTQIDGQATVFNVAAAIADGSNSSSVDIKNSAKMTDLNGDLDIAATSSNSIDTQALVKGKENSFVGTAVNITDFDSSADVKIDTNIAANSVDIAAGNSVVKNNVSANNNVGSSYLMNLLVSRATGTKTVQDIKKFAGKVKEKIFGESKPDIETALTQLGEWASVGVSVGVVNETNNANVTLTKNAQITAQNSSGNKGDINVTANNYIADTSMSVTGATNNHSSDVSNEALVNAAVLYSDMDSNATVTLEGGTAHDEKNAAYTQLDGANINVQANSKFNYGRIDKMIGDILSLCEKLEKAYASNETYQQHVNELKTKAKEFRDKCAADPNYADSVEGNEAAIALANAANTVSIDAAAGSVDEQIKDIFAGPLSVAGMAAQFANPNNYANFQAGASTGGKSEDGASVAVSGAVNLNYITNNANVIVGKNTEITGSGKVDVNASAAQEDVAFNGKLGLTGGADNAAGGTVGIHFGEVNSMVAVAEGAEVTGSAINIGADNDVAHTAITFGAGKSGNAFVGMGSYLEGDSNSIVSIDDEASLTATGRDQYNPESQNENNSTSDTITGSSDGSVNITAHNNTVLTNIAGGGAIGGENAGIGASVAITDYDVYNMAGIVNNDAGVSANTGEVPENETEDQKRERVQKENIAKLQELTKTQSGLTDDEYANLFGSAENTIENAGINAHDVNANVLTDGTINTVTIAGSAVTGSDYDKPGIGDKFDNFKKNMENRVENGITKIDTAVQNKYNGTMESPNLKPTNMEASNPNAGQKRPSFTISGAGSSSVNLIDGASTALLDGAKITLVEDNAGNAGKLNVSAADSSFIGAWSGAAAISWKTFMTDQNWSNKSVGFAGTVGVNMVNTDVASIIRNSTINNAGSITNTADKSGALVAAGLGMAVEKAGVTGSGGNNYGGAASVSVNIAENDIYAVMQGNTVNEAENTEKTVLTNTAYDNDVQVTGGINASIALGGQQGVSVGGTVTYAELTNNVQSAIVGGTYNNMGTVDVSAATDITQVGAAVGVAAATGTENNYGIDGVAAYNQLNNNADAVIDGATITADKVNVAAYDTDLGENKHTEYINQRGLDATGNTYLQNVSDTAEDLYEKDDKGEIKLDENGQPILKVGQTGNTIVTGALGITATTGSGGGSGSAAISISDINNDFNASIKNSNIKTNGLAADGADDVADVNVLAKSDTLLVNIAAGGAGASKGFAGAGSFGWSTVNNDNTASIENSTIDAATTKVNAISGTLGVNVAGQVTVGKQAIGLAVAYNDLENNTGAYILGSDIKNTDTNDEGNEVIEETDVTVAAENSGKMYAIGAGVGVSTDTAAANGTIAINRGNNNLEAVVGDYGSGEDTRHTKITNAKNIDVTSNDNASVLSVAGGVGVSKKVTVGGSVAYNEIGNISGNADGKIQNNTAQINNAVITTANGATIDVQALDNADLTTAAVGVGVAAGGNVAVQGAAATALINKDTEASMNGVTISKAYEQDNSGADVNVKASSSNDIVTTADTVSVMAGGTGAAVGAGVAVNRSEANVNALVSGGTMDVDDLAVKAANNANITTVGVGGSVAGGTGAGVTGSVAVNMLGNDTTAKIDGGANITADNNVVVDAQSDEQIANYAGSASVAVTGAAVGLSVSVNQIDGTTNASIEGSGTQVNAAGNDEDAELNNTVKDEDILNDFVDSSTFNSQKSLGDKRTDGGKTYSGVAVSASSTHSIKSFLINAGGAAQGAAVNGTVNVNQTDGSTTAAIKDASINQKDGFAGDVNVIAHDYSNSAGIVGSAGVAGEGAGIGLGSDTNTLSRDVTAEITGAENNIKGNAVNVEAEAKQGVSSMAIGVGGAGIGAGVANGTTVTLVDGKTIAKINGSNITAGSLNVTAKHLDRINTNGISIGVGGLGAGIGIGVAVLNENSTTEATVENTDVTYTNADGETVIDADNTTEMNYQLYNVGGAVAGVAGSVGVANVNSKVNANVIGSKFGDDSETNKAGSIAISAANDIDFDQTAGTAGAGAVGVGVGVSVNTIDSQVQAKVENSRLYAKGNIDVTAEETRNVDQLAVNAGVGAGAAGVNVMVTNVGKEVSNAYGTDGMEDADVEKAYEEAQKAIHGGKLTSEYTLGALNDDETSAATANTAAPGKGATADADKSIVKVDIDGATLNAGGSLNVTADETTNVNMTGFNEQLGVVGSGAGTVGVLNVHRNSGVEITSAMLDAADVDIKAIQSGISKLDIYQGTGALGNTLGAAYGTVNSEGKTGVGIGNSTITSDNDVDITASDESRTEVNAVGVSIAAGGAASIIVAEGTNRAETTVTADQTTITAANDINLHAERQAKDEDGNTVDDEGNKYNSLNISAIAASGGLTFAGAGVSAIANEFGKVGAEITDGSAFAAGDDIYVTALNSPSVKAVTDADSASMLASAAITVAEANIGGEDDDEHLKTIVNISDGNSFTADSLTAEAKANASQNVDMKGISISASPFGSSGAAQVNTGGAAAYSDVEVTVGNNVFKGNKEGINLTVNGENTVTQTANAQGIGIGMMFATGTNKAETTAQLSTQVTAKGAADDSSIHDVDIKASSYAKIDNDANGYGGAFIDISPYAAMVENNYTADTDVTLSGTWNTTGSFTARALNGMDIDLESDAVRAAIVGGSGTWLNNVINNAANVTIDKANITTDGAQSYIAQNQVDYVGEIDGSGYGGVNVNATNYKDDLDLTAGVDIKNSALTGAGDEGSITAFASTEGTIHSKNSLKSAGVIPVALAFSDHDITYDNGVNVIDSTLTTDKKEQDITLAATDDTTVKLETIADTQGGAVGAASAEASNTFDRGNKITVGSGSTLHSSNDINLYAGANTEGISSSLDLQVLADAYNKTVIPLATAPKVDNAMRQANQVSVGGTVESVRHINASAAKGATTVTESAQEYNLYQGTSGSSTVASTTLGETVPHENGDANFVEVKEGASLTAGIHNKLDLVISGEIPLQAAGEDGKVDSESVDLSNITVTVSAGAGEDWFDPATVQKGTTPIKNNLMDRYNEVVRLMGQYEEGTSEYASYKSERDSLLLEMKRMGMATVDKNGNLTPSSEINVPAVSLPDIVVSGGNINIDSDSLKGGGKLTAQGAPQINITNASDAYLVVNDVTVQDAGGQIRMNGSTLTANTAGNEMSAAQIHADGVTGGASQINISGTASMKEGMQADIGVFGDITNTSGDVTITNKSYNLNILGNISGRNVSLAAENGSVTQTSTEGFINIGGDPITKYQFSKDVANAIQEYIYDQFVANNDYKIPQFGSYAEYVDWIKTNIVASGKYGITEADLVCKEDDPADPGNKIVAGGNVYINGLNVNIGGLVQSGYGKYTVTLDSNAQAKVDDLDKEWQGKQEALSDSAVMANEKYLINAGGQVYNQETGVYDYEIRVYYNPSTGELLTDSVSVSGGKIYITGNISSTGGGKIMAMDGAADIAIDTSQIDKNVTVNTITNSDISGLISITDKNKTDGKGHYLVTEYRNGEQRSYYSGGALSDWSAVTGDMAYDPEKGLQYQWTGGVSGEVKTKYQYTEDFLFWGLLDYGKSDEFVAGLEAAGKKPQETPVSSGEQKGKENGVVITKGDGGKDFSITGSYKNTGDETYSDISPDMKYDGFWGKVFGYGTTTYTWTGKKGTASSTTTSVAADKQIEIGFIGNGNGSGNISVTTGGDMTLAGNISNASVVDGNSQIVGKGSVSLTSQTGAITGNGTIHSDDVNLKAAEDINVNHASIGSGATVNIASDNGDIHFTSSKGDLSIEQVVTGGANPITAETGSVYLEAAGSILDAHTSGDYAVKGQRIDLVSKTGSIGTEDTALTILGGSELYSSDTMASSVNASAAGDIVLTQTDGNMRLGTIVSTGGDAVLTVEDGSFVDAHPSENSSSSSAQDKIDRWLESGLIDAEDKANESTNAADKAKAERVEALTNRANSLAGGDKAKVESYWAAADAFYKDEGIQQAKETYLNAVAEADGNKEKINAAYEQYQKDYQNAKTKYFENKGFSDGEQDLITSYAEVSNSDNYGWSKNELLYAIQDSVLNTKPGEVQTVDTPNVSAKNITLNAASGGIGIDGEAQTISYDALNSEENLKLLANAKAGDLTWDEENQQVTIRQQQAITVEVKDESGKVNVDVEGNGNVYLAGVKGTTLDINDIETGGNVRLQGDDGVEVGSIKGGNLIIAGGEGSITSGNANDLYVHTELTGSLDAKAKGDIYISEAGDLDILTLATDKAAHLAATGSILMENVKGSTAQGRLNAAEVNLTAIGSIGGAGEDQAIRILDNGAVVNATAVGGIWLSGESGKESTGNLVIGSIRGESFDLTSVSDVSLGRESTEEDEWLTGSIKTTNGDASISAVNVDLADGTVNVGTNDFNVTAMNGNITQSEASAGLIANHVNLSSTGSQLLLSETNQINSVTVKGLHNDSLTGDVEIHSAADSFDVQFGDTDGDTAAGITVNDGSIVIQHNGSADGKLTVTGSATTQKANGSDVNADISFSGKQSAIDVEGTMNAGDNFSATTESGAINITGTVTAHNGEVKATTNSGAISFNGDVTAMAGDVTATTGSGSVTFGGSVSAEQGNITATTDEGDIRIDGAADATTDILLDSGSGNISVTNTSTAGQNFSATTGSGDITLDGTVTAETGKVLAQTGKGTLHVGGDVNSALDTKLQAGVEVDDSGTIIVDGSIASGTEVHVSATNGDIVFKGTTTASAGDVKAEVTGDGSITFNGAVTAVSEGEGGGNIVANVSGTGDITTESNAVFDADKDVLFTTNVGNITTNSAVTAGEDIVFKVLTEGNMTLRDDLKSEQNIDLNVNSGNILFEGTQDGVHEVIDVTSNHGDVTVSINEGGKGDIKDTNGKGADGDWANIRAEEGNVTVKHDGVGDVDLYELYAKKDAGVSVADGNLHLVNVSGNLVAVFVKSEGKDMDVENIEAAQQIAISGSNMDLDSITQREDGDGFLVITPEGTADDQPIDNLVIGDILTNGGVRFDHLWLNTGDIHVSEGALHLDKVYVQDKATFSTDDMTTNVFGSAPVYDDSVSSSYWVNTGINSPKDDLAAWNSDELNDKWMYIFFSPEGNVQISNGNLLHLADNNYVYNQRYSQVNWMNMFTDKDFYTFYDKYYAPELSYHERYGLTSGDGHSVENAEEDELIVE